MTLTEAIQEYLDKQMPLERLILLVPHNFEHSRIYGKDMLLIDLNGEEEEHEEYIEFFETEFGPIRIQRTSITNRIKLIDDTQMVTVDEENQSVKYE